MSTKLTPETLAEIRFDVDQSEPASDLTIMFRQHCDDLLNHCTALEEELKAAQEAIRLTLEKNRHLADGDNCTLILLKRVCRTFEAGNE